MNRRVPLYVVGIGPGDQSHLSPAATSALEEASDWVGYSYYLELLTLSRAGKRCHPFALGCEEQRARRALELAASGHPTALISSGDPGIYAMAEVVFRLLDHFPEPAWRQVEPVVVPGISAMQLAAARLGAPLGDDFCVVSLSDLHTPWPLIARRLRAVAQADLVLACYNPASRRRHWQLGQLKEILLDYREPGTPVAVARKLARPGERLQRLQLQELEPQMVDMFSLVVVGNSVSRWFRREEQCWLYTPRHEQGGEPA